MGRVKGFAWPGILVPARRGGVLCAAVHGACGLCGSMVNTCMCVVPVDGARVQGPSFEEKRVESCACNIVSW